MPLSTGIERAQIQQLYDQGDAAHDFDHVLRVVALALRIAREEGADVRVVEAAAYLHDLPVPGGTRQAHHLVAAEQAESLAAGWGFTPNQVENVGHAIRSHRFRDQSIQPQTLEARCLYDADKLDSIGAIGIGRAFAYSGVHGARLWHQPVSAVPADDARPQGRDYTPVHEYVYKLRRLLPTLHTESARRIGAGRHAFLHTFFAQLDAEMTGDA